MIIDLDDLFRDISDNPNTTNFARPRFKKQNEKIENIFHNSFAETSAFLKSKCAFEERVAHHNMDSGIPIEDYFRSEFGKYIPSPFLVGAGTVVDSDNYSAGDCDFIIYDPALTPLLKFPATSTTRSKIFPVECTFGVIETKKTLGPVHSIRFVFRF